MNSSRALRNLAGVAALLWVGAAAAQSSPYYIADGDAATMWIVQNGAIQSTVSTFSVGEAIAVRSTVLLCDYNEQGTREYTLAGAPTGATFTGGGTYHQLLDGTTDGVSYNYSIAWGFANPNPVLRFDLNWQNPTVLFNLPADVAAMAITYDTSTNHLYIAFDGETVIREFDLAGNQLGSFDTLLPASRMSCLAYEAATNSLWFKFNSGGTIYNYSKSGAQLAALVVPGLDGFNDWGGEFQARSNGQPVPALSTAGALVAMLLIAAVGAVVLFVRR